MARYEMCNCELQRSMKISDLELHVDFLRTSGEDKIILACKKMLEEEISRPIVHTCKQWKKKTEKKERKEAEKRHAYYYC